MAILALVSPSLPLAIGAPSYQCACPRLALCQGVLDLTETSPLYSERVPVATWYCRQCLTRLQPIDLTGHRHNEATHPCWASWRPCHVCLLLLLFAVCLLDCWIATAKGRTYWYLKDCNSSLLLCCTPIVSGTLDNNTKRTAVASDRASGN